jgi:hypothetical protein
MKKSERQVEVLIESLIEVSLIEKVIESLPRGYISVKTISDREIISSAITTLYEAISVFGRNFLEEPDNLSRHATSPVNMRNNDYRI